MREKGNYPNKQEQLVPTRTKKDLRIFFDEKNSQRVRTNKGGACGVIVIVVGNGHGNTSSNPGRD